ncbi:hypothetical protein YC2023_056046 [Brassica napus]
MIMWMMHQMRTMKSMMMIMWQHVTSLNHFCIIQKKEKHDDDMVDSDGKSEGSEDEFYKQVRQNKEAKRAAKAEEPSSTLLLPETVDGKRLISNERIDSTSQQGQKEPEKELQGKDKYMDKVKRRGGQVREIRKPSGSYGGEVSGINPNISHRIRIKN